jgi:hypothetical protein
VDIEVDEEMVVDIEVAEEGEVDTKVETGEIIEVGTMEGAQTLGKILMEPTKEEGDLILEAVLREVVIVAGVFQVEILVYLETNILRPLPYPLV